MKTFINSKHNTNITISNRNIFDSIISRINAEHNGCTVFVPHVCNNIDTFGAGFAAQVADKFPSVKADYHMLGKKFLQQNMGYCQIIKVLEDQKYRHKLYFVNMIAQNGIIGPNNPRPLNYFSLAKSMSLLSNYILNNTGFNNGQEKIEIHCPKFGSGLAGGKWDFISNLIEDIWGKYHVTTYNYNKNNNYVKTNKN
jgi:hypothetical protein